MFNKARMMQAAGNGGGPVEISLTIASSLYNYNLWNNRGSNYEAGNSIITLTINSNRYVGSTSTGTYALTIPNNFHADDEIIIINNGYIYGRGGAGGKGAANSANNSTNGGNGGHALRVQRPVSIHNNGVIAGGGGGGGGGGSYSICLSSYAGSCNSYAFYSGNGGGGGQGYAGGTGGVRQGGANTASNGSNGSHVARGAGGTAGGQSVTYGGNGGTRGNNGSASASGSFGGGRAGGIRGYYAVGNSNITWTKTGTRLGRVG